MDTQRILHIIQYHYSKISNWNIFENGQKEHFYSPPPFGTQIWAHSGKTKK